MRRQHQKNKDDRGPEDEEPAVAGELLLVGEIRPFEAETIGEPLGGEFFHSRQGIAGGVARQRAPLDLCGGIKIIARHAVRPGDVAELGDRADRHHLAFVVARLQIDDVADLVAEWRIGLGRYPVGPAQIIEVVDVGRAEIDLQGLKDAVGRDAEHLGAHTVDIGIDLWRPGVEQRKDADETGRLIGRRDNLLRRRLERRQSASTLILHHHLEAAGRADPTHRGRRDGDDESVLDLR